MHGIGLECYSIGISLGELADLVSGWCWKIVVRQISGESDRKESKELMETVSMRERWGTLASMTFNKDYLLL